MGLFDGSGGLFGNSSQAGNGGVLGGAKGLSGWDIASIIGSGLQDAYAGYRGQPGGNVDDALSILQKRALLTGLNSSDPEIRQKAYQQAAVHGIDPRPFQQQQANAALPGLLGRISQPQSVTMPSATGTLPDGSKLTTAPVTATGGPMSLSDALQSAPPELQSQYAPDIIKQQIEADKPYDLAPGSTRYRGTTPLVTAPIKPNPNEPFNADGTPNKAYQAYQVAIARARAEARADFRAPPKASATGAINLPHPGSLY